MLVVAVAELFCYPFGHSARSVRNVLAVLQALRLYRLLKVLEEFMAPLHVMMKALAGGIVNVVSAGVFVGLIWMTAAICITSIMKNGPTTQELAGASSQLRKARDDLGSGGKSLLTIIEITTGGTCFGKDILDPLFSSKYFVFKFCGLGLFILMTLSTFYIWNLVLGVYVKQVVLISQEVEVNQEKQKVCISQRNLQWLKEVFQDADVDKDGCLTREELSKYIGMHEEEFKAVGLEYEELTTLHSTMDMDGSGKVLVSDFLFGVLKVTGASKTLDMLSIDFRQKILFRGLTSLDSLSACQLDSVTADLDLLLEHTNFLDDRVQELNDSLKRARGDLESEIQRLQKLTLKMNRSAAQNQQLLQERRKRENTDFRHGLEVQLDAMQAEVDRLSMARNLSILAAAGPRDMMALRKAIRQRLDAEVQPWLDKQIAQASSPNR